MHLQRRAHERHVAVALVQPVEAVRRNVVRDEQLLERLDLRLRRLQLRLGALHLALERVHAVRLAPRVAEQAAARPAAVVRLQLRHAAQDLAEAPPHDGHARPVHEQANVVLLRALVRHRLARREAAERALHHEDVVRLAHVGVQLAPAVAAVDALPELRRLAQRAERLGVLVAAQVALHRQRRAGDGLRAEALELGVAAVAHEHLRAPALRAHARERVLPELAEVELARVALRLRRRQRELEQRHEHDEQRRRRDALVRDLVRPDP
mmetsp:Transcript_20995/g.63958  ORF Transcript_20995/g.63958 Transcript_20995/m.63958 type:complete len:267 (+) Transcript_20995:1449-2249(+)